MGYNKHRNVLDTGNHNVSGLLMYQIPLAKFKYSLLHIFGEIKFLPVQLISLRTLRNEHDHCPLWGIVKKHSVVISVIVTCTIWTECGNYFACPHRH